MNNDSNCVTEVEHEAPMKDGTPVILYTKETRGMITLITRARVILTLLTVT